ncbi:MAG: hypothetical protein K1X44_05740 [Alphaproteobacteria bacterium]|nr:hypothetical protein [Alphaproteobacteria bacterium]
MDSFSLRLSVLKDMRLTNSKEKSDFFQFKEKALYGQITVRADAQNKEYTNKIRKLLNIETLPLQVNDTRITSSLKIFCLKPNEWLITTLPNHEKKLMADLLDNFIGLHAYAINVTEQKTIINLQGTKIIDILNKGTSINFHPDYFQPNTCKQTSFNQINILLYRYQDLQEFDLYIERSCAKYFWLWFETQQKYY